MKSTDTSEFELAGRKFILPCLPFEKNRIVVNATCHGLNALKALNGPDKTPLRITDIDYIYLAVFEAVSFVDPKIDRKEFNGWGLSMPDLVIALTKVAIQTGVLVRSDGGESEGSKEV